MAAVFILLVCTGIQIATASIVNVAMGKPASMSSRWRDGYNAGTAVDGNTDAAGYSMNQIIETGTGHPFAWWKVDLEREVKDATVRIYFRTDFKVRRNGVKLYTSTSPFPESNATSQGQLCHTVTGDPSGSDIPDVYNVTCPGRWRYLLLYMDTDNDGDGPVLDFGEVEVLACSGGTYGHDCTKTCSSRNCVTMTTTCDVDGRCPGGCKSGWTGMDCTHECDSGFYGGSCTIVCTKRHCLNASSTCNHVSGQCDGGCLSGYQGLACTYECSPGMYGLGCSMACGNCSSGEGCDHVTGSCPRGCNAGWRNEKCNEVCIGDTYGPDCTAKCGKCDGVCDSVDGRCPAGCLVGYNGTKCDVSVQADPSVKEPVYFGVVSLVGAVVGTFSAVVLLAVGIHLCLTRQGRIQWIKTSDDKKQVRESRDLTQMSSISPRQTETSEHAQSSNHLYKNDYAILDAGTKTVSIDYDVIKPNYYQNI